MCCSNRSIDPVVKEKAPVVYFVGIILTLLLQTSLQMNINGTTRGLGWDQFCICRPAIALILGRNTIYGIPFRKNEEDSGRGSSQVLVSQLQISSRWIRAYDDPLRPFFELLFGDVLDSVWDWMCILQRFFRYPLLS